jgi:hypothetical protein
MDCGQLGDYVIRKGYLRAPNLKIPTNIFLKSLDQGFHGKETKRPSRLLKVSCRFEYLGQDVMLQIRAIHSRKGHDFACAAVSVRRFLTHRGVNVRGCYLRSDGAAPVRWQSSSSSARRPQQPRRSFSTV